MRLPAVRSRLSDRILLIGLAPLTLVTMVGAHTDAVATRFVDKLGVDGVDFKLSSLIKTALKPAGGAGQRELNDLLVAGVAVLLVGAVVFFLLGVFRTFGGRRGGIESVVQVVFALMIAIAGLEVLA